MKTIAYYRVSTQAQQQSGLGLEAQAQSVRAFLGREPDASFTELESGRKNHRPQLMAALAKAQRENATIVIAKLDRLSRNAAFLLTLLDSNVPILAVDLPNADRFTLQILAVVAEKEARSISERTKAALAAAKARGTRLGSPILSQVRTRGIATRQLQSLDYARKMKPILDDLRPLAPSLPKLADALNRLGHKTPRGKRFYPASVAWVQSVISQLPHS